MRFILTVIVLTAFQAPHLWCCGKNGVSPSGERGTREQPRQPRSRIETNKTAIAITLGKRDNGSKSGCNALHVPYRAFITVTPR